MKKKKKEKKIGHIIGLIMRKRQTVTKCSKLFTFSVDACCQVVLNLYCLVIKLFIPSK